MMQERDMNQFKPQINSRLDTATEMRCGGTCRLTMCLRNAKALGVLLLRGRKIMNKMGNKE